MTANTVGFNLPPLSTDPMFASTPPDLQLTRDPMLAGEASGIGNLGAMMAINGASAAISTGLGVLAASYAYGSQQAVMEKQAQMQADNFQYQTDSAGVARDAKLDLIQAEVENQNMQVDGQAKLNKAIEKRAIAEGKVAEQKAIKKDAKTTKKFAEVRTGKAALGKLFSVELRSRPFYGNPAR